MKSERQIDKKKRKFMFSDKTLKAQVSNKNVILYYHYLKNNYTNNGNQAEIASRLFKDEIEEKFFLNKEEWCTLEDYVNIVERVVGLTGDFEVTKIVGSLLPQYKKEYKLDAFTEAALNNLGAFFLGPVEILRQISFYNSLFNKTKDMHFVAGKNGECVIKVKFKPGVNPVYDFVSEWHIEGMLKSVLELFEVTNVRVNTCLKEYDLELLITEKFDQLKDEVVIDGNGFYLGDKKIAEKVVLLPEQIKDQEVCSQNYRKASKDDEQYSWRIIEDVFMDNKYLVLKAGDFYNCPYFITRITWDRISYARAVAKLINSQWSTISPLGRGYTKLIQERQRQEQEAARLRAEKQKIEREYNDLLLKNYIHPRFIERAKLGPIPFKNVFVTNIFVDIHQSTQQRKDIGDNAFRRNRNIFLRFLKKNLMEVAGEWAWLNKMMGDGCYIVIGADNYFNDAQDDKHMKQALDFIVKLHEDIEKFKKETGELRDFYLRFAAESGQVEIGEAHEAHVDSLESDINLSHLRIFDTDGHSVSLAFRLENMSKQIMKSRKQTKQSGAFMGPALLNYSINKSEKIDHPISSLDLSALGLALRDYTNIKNVGEITLKKFN